MKCLILLEKIIVHMKCLILSEKIIKMSSAVIVIDALRVKHARKYRVVIWKNLQSQHNSENINQLT